MFIFLSGLYQPAPRPRGKRSISSSVVLNVMGSSPLTVKISNDSNQLPLDMETDDIKYEVMIEEVPLYDEEEISDPDNGKDEVVDEDFPIRYEAIADMDQGAYLRNDDQDQAFVEFPIRYEDDSNIDVGISIDNVGQDQVFEDFPIQYGAISDIDQDINIQDIGHVDEFSDADVPIRSDDQVYINSPIQTQDNYNEYQAQLENVAVSETEKNKLEKILFGPQVDGINFAVDDSNYLSSEAVGQIYAKRLNAVDLTNIKIILIGMATTFAVFCLVVMTFYKRKPNKVVNLHLKR